MSARITKAVFPIAGVSRLRAGSRDLMARISELRPIVDKPIVQFAIDEARAAGVEEFIFVTCDEKFALESHLTHAWPANSDFVETARNTSLAPSEAIFVRQPERRGIGHAILMAKALLKDEPFAVIIPNLLVLGDRSALSQMVSDYEDGTVLIGAAELTPEELHSFGVLQMDNNCPGDATDTEATGSVLGLVSAVVEKPEPGNAPSQLAAFGRWILPSRALDTLQDLNCATAGEISLTGCINALVSEVPVKACKIEGHCYDLRDNKGLVRATVAYALQNPDVSPAVSQGYEDFIDSGVRTLRSVILSRRYEDLTSLALLAQMIEKDFRDEIALISSYGADSSVLLHMVSRIDASLPVLFLDTGKLFAETLEFQEMLSRRLGLTDVRLIRPVRDELQRVDPEGVLHSSDPDACCHFRKTLPLERAVEPFSAWITGRRRFQSTTRTKLALFDEDRGGRIKVNPLAAWTREDLSRYVTRHDLPAHPLVAQGYRSIGCMPCTTPVKEGEDERAGRWRGSEKVECGIHIVDGKVVRTGTD